jgi:hypothetical protein
VTNNKKKVIVIIHLIIILLSVISMRPVSRSDIGSVDLRFSVEREGGLFLIPCEPCPFLYGIIALLVCLVECSHLQNEIYEYTYITFTVYIIFIGLVRSVRYT